MRLIEWLANPLRVNTLQAFDSDAPLHFHRALPGYEATPLIEAPELADEPPHDPGLELVAATDGNHGRAVARVARAAGLRATILVPAGTVRARIDAIAGEGATVEVINGSYDDAVRRSAEMAGPRRLVLSDTSWPGYEEVPRWVIEGYATIFHEIEEQAAGGIDITFVPIGVGALAAAAARHLAGRSRLAGVEPTSAACMLESARAGEITEVPGPHGSIMAGLNAGLPSMVAWPLVSGSFDIFCAAEDTVAIEGIRRLAELGLLTEGVTDPEAYARLVVG